MSDKTRGRGTRPGRDLGVAAAAVPDPRTTTQARAAIDECAPALIVWRASCGSVARIRESDAGRNHEHSPSLLPKYPVCTRIERFWRPATPSTRHRHFRHGGTRRRPADHSRPCAGAPDDDEHPRGARTAEEHHIYPLAVGWYMRGASALPRRPAWLDVKPWCARSVAAVIAGRRSAGPRFTGQRSCFEPLMPAPSLTADSSHW